MSNTSVTLPPDPGVRDPGDPTGGVTALAVTLSTSAPFSLDNFTGNGSDRNASDVPYKPPYEVWQSVLICLACSIIIIGTVLGNALVCIAVGIVRKLRTPSNLLIVSLAISDLLVGILVMPFAIMYEVMGIWILNEGMCDAWTSLDVMLCTASILNLCMISVDRYFVITRPFTYAMKRTPKRMALMITGVWMASALISIPPLFGWKTSGSADEEQCVISQVPGYQFYATIGAFYLPLAVMIVIYYRIYMVSSRIAKAEAKSSMGGEPVASSLSGASTPIRKDSHCIDKEENHNFPNGAAKKRSRDDSTHEMLPRVPEDDENHHQHHHHHSLNHLHVRGIGGVLKKSRMSSNKESKATKTLGVIMGAFTACWLPFFIVALIRPFCTDPAACIPHWLTVLLLWLGYANSFLNPIIYARFNRDFRTPFKEILLCRCAGINIRLRSESYAEQFGPGPGALRDCIRPHLDTVARYQSQGQTVVKLGNGDVNNGGSEAKV